MMDRKDNGVEVNCVGKTDDSCKGQQRRRPGRALVSVEIREMKGAG